MSQGFRDAVQERLNAHAVGDIMTHGFNLQAVAYETKAAQDLCRQIEPFTSRWSDFGNAEAYAVAHLVHEMRMKEGAVPVGRKIGFTNPEMWSTYGVSAPIWGYVYDTTVVRLTKEQASCRIGKFAEPKIEPEIVVHLRSAPPMNASPADVLACSDWIAHGIEIVQSHFPGWQFQAPDTIADWGLHATLLVGEPQDVNRLGPAVESDLELFAVTLSRNGTVCARGRGSNALGSPLQAVAHIIAVLAQQPHALPLDAGELVTTGTLTAALSIHAGETWTTEIDGIALPGLSVSVDL